MNFSKKKPTGKSLSPNLWPNAQFSIAGFCTKDHLIKDLISISEKLNYKIPIANVYGSPNTMLNSGRVIRKKLMFSEIKEIISYYDMKNIGIFLTFSNQFVKECLLEDESINFLLERIHCSNKHINGVIITNDILNDYIKINYPNLIRKASILKVVSENGCGDFNYYRRLLTKYDSITLHPDDIFNVDLLSKIKEFKSKVELLINECCLINCKYRSKHYELLSSMQFEPNNLALYEKINNFGNKFCKSFDMEKQLNSKKRNINLSRSELKQLYDIGYRNFKIQGRTDYDHIFIFDCVRFLFEEEIVFPLVYKLFCSSQHYGFNKDKTLSVLLKSEC